MLVAGDPKCRFLFKDLSYMCSRLFDHEDVRVKAMLPAPSVVWSSSLVSSVVADLQLESGAGKKGASSDTPFAKHCELMAASLVR